MFDVTIKGRNLTAHAKLLEALTTSGCLSDRITWEEFGDRIVLHVDDAVQPGTTFKPNPFSFTSKGFEVTNG